MGSLLPHLSCFVLLNIILVLAGYWIVRKNLIWQSWGLLMAGVLLIHLVFLNEHPVIRMLTLITTAFTAMKVISTAETYKGKRLNLTFRQWLAYTLGWAGMRAQPFEALGGRPLPAAWPKIIFGISRVIAGFALILLGRQIAALPVGSEALYIILSAIFLVAFSLILHFGLLSISAGMWRLLGVNTYSLFISPVKAKSLSEFWSKRWNLAFSEMISISIFRPLKGKVGSLAALMLAFLFSGLLHELAISVPVKGGYGLPLLYFTIQGTGVVLEKVLFNYRVRFLQHKVFARAWVTCWLIIPIPLLFHSGFINEIVWPLAGLNPP